MPNEITLHELSTLLNKAATELKAPAPTESRNDLIADIEKTVKVIDEKKTVVAQAINDAKLTAIAATERIRELQPLALEIARLGCAETQRRDAQINANDREEDRQYKANTTIGVLALTTVLFFLGGFAFLGTQQATNGHAIALIGLAVCWTGLAIACLSFLYQRAR